MKQRKRQVRGCLRKASDQLCQQSVRVGSRMGLELAVLALKLEVLWEDASMRQGVEPRVEEQQAV